MLSSTAMHLLMVGMYFMKCIIRCILSLCKHHKVTYTNLVDIAYYTPRPQARTACYYCTKRYESKSNKIADDIIKRHGKQMYEAAACVTQHTVLKQALCISRKSNSEIINKYSIVNT